MGWKEKDFVLPMVKMQGNAFEYASDDMKQDKEVVLAAVQQRGDTWIYASNDLKNDKDVLFAAFKNQGITRRQSMTAKELMLAKVAQDSDSLQYASEDLKQDKEVVIAACSNKGSALKFAKGGLNQDPDCLKASGLWDATPEEMVYTRTEKAILSVKFSLAEKSTPYATQFALAMKNDPYLRDFSTYNPNAWCKKSCDPKFTDIQHKCRGTLDTCLFPEHENLTTEKRPTSTSCWRFAFRFHQEECKATSGFMIQVEETEGLGAGQNIETEMAKQVGMKVFRITPLWLMALSMTGLRR